MTKLSNKLRFRPQSAKSQNIDMAPKAPQKQKHHKTTKHLKITLVFLVALAFAASGLGWYTYRQGTKPNQKALESLQSVLGVKEAAEDLKTIQSKLGFQLKFNDKQLKALAYILDPKFAENGQYTIATEEDVLKPDDFAIVEVYQADVSKAEAISSLNISTNINADFFAKRRQEHGDLSDLELVIAHYAPKNTATASHVAGKEEKITINGTEYTKITYQVTDTSYGLRTAESLTKYYTVQNNRPFVIELSKSDNRDQPQIAALYNVIKTIEYFPPGEVPAAKLQSGGLGSTDDQSTTSENDSALPTGTANVPAKLKDGTALKVAAKSQPAVVRIGTAYCADIDLLLPDKNVFMSIEQSCTAGVGSGSIVSEDGYISTNGHVVRFTPALTIVTSLIIRVENGDNEPLIKYFGYLVGTGVMTADSLDQLLAAVRRGSPDAISKLIYSAEGIPRENIKVKTENYQYAIQLSDEPIKLNIDRTRFFFEFTQNVVEAKYVDSDFDPYRGSGGKQSLTEATTSDVAILKMEDKDFPIVNIGSIDGLKKGDLVTAIGFPAFVDGALETKQPKTIPSVTQGNVEEVFNDAPTNGRKLIGTNVPIAGGNSGGPAFDSNGLVIGLATYAAGQTCGDGQCFNSYGVMRDIADYKALLAKNNITLNSSSQTADAWNEGVDSFALAHYKKAVKSFKKVQQIYPAHYLATSFITAAEQKIAAGEDKTPGISLLAIVLGSLALLSVLIIVVVILLTRRRKTAQIFAAPPQLQPSPAQPAPAPQMPTAPVFSQAPAYAGQTAPAPVPPPAPAPVQAAPISPQPPAPIAPPPPTADSYRSAVPPLPRSTETITQRPPRPAYNTPSATSSMPQPIAPPPAPQPQLVPAPPPPAPSPMSGTMEPVIIRPPSPPAQPPQNPPSIS